MEAVIVIVVLVVVIFYYPLFFKKRYDSFAPKKSTDPFPMGEVVNDFDVWVLVETNEEFRNCVIHCLVNRYAIRDWWDITLGDKAYNNESLEVGRAVLGVYILPYFMAWVFNEKWEPVDRIAISTDEKRTRTKISLLKKAWK